MSGLTAFFLAMALFAVGLALLTVFPILGFFFLSLLAAALLEKLCWILLVPYVLWWFLVHGRKNAERWTDLRQYRYAHRGFHDKPAIPENSLPAFARAVEHGFGAELDVHLTEDGRLAVLHDSALKRVCGAEGDVEDRTAAELDAFRLEGTDNRIPFLEEVLPLFEGKTPLVVEIKPAGGNYAVLTEKTVACLDRFSVKYCVESFDPRVLLWLRTHRPDIIRGQLAQNFLRDAGGLNLFHRIMLTNLFYNVRTRPDFIAYKFEDRKNLSRSLCCRLWGVQAFYWTLRSPADLARAERESALAIFETFDPTKEAAS